jgi:hypothetical protein
LGMASGGRRGVASPSSTTPPHSTLVSPRAVSRDSRGGEFPSSRIVGWNQAGVSHFCEDWAGIKSSRGLNEHMLTHMLGFNPRCVDPRGLGLDPGQPRPNRTKPDWYWRRVGYFGGF